MSRYYRVNVFVKSKKITEKTLVATMTDRGWSTDRSDWNDNIAELEGTGYLCGGTSEEEAHDDIYKALKKLDKKALIRTWWTNLEDQPIEEYGDEIEGC